MKYLNLLISFLLVQSVFAQSKLPVIKATSKNVTINDGGYLDKNAWTLSPKTKPDIFTADRTRKTKWVTFYTDIDSIRVKVKPGTKFNFIVLLNGKDSCYTQIVSAIPPEDKLRKIVAKDDTIPFTLTSFNAIAVKAVINNTDTLNLHFDVSSFGFHFTRDAILKKTKLLSNQPDALAGKTKPDYNNLNKVVKLQMGNTVWNAPEILPTTTTAHDMDGRFGWDLFEGKIVEIDYDHHLLIIHSELPKTLKGYTRSKMEFIHSFACIKGTFEIEGKKYTGNFSMDTGSDQAIILDNTWAAKQNFPKDLRLIKLSVLSDPRGVKYETKIVLSPLLKIDDFRLTNIPTLMVGSLNPTGLEINYLGNDLLKRFNIILDFKNDCLYLKPNQLMSLKYRANS
ncbi:hypothetical protein [Mucilaginibacter sp.]|uniref:hypothetical protein n=1 Tax=Mucilaginibacter sp. TaxID=1882438 RepID=UPI0025DA7641|nr:hypothetical protein [Mucilaginibacter sp.]